MKLLSDSALDKAREGLTSLDQALSVWFRTGVSDIRHSTFDIRH